MDCYHFLDACHSRVGKLESDIPTSGHTVGWLESHNRRIATLMLFICWDLLSSSLLLFTPMVFRSGLELALCTVVMFTPVANTGITGVKTSVRLHLTRLVSIRRVQRGLPLGYQG